MKKSLSIALALVACNAQESEGAGVHYTRVHATSQSSSRAVGLCELAEYYAAGAGVYRVAQMTGFVEQVPEAPNGSLAGFTYVDLRLLEAWTTKTPKNPRVRIEGGPLPTGIEGDPGGFAIDLAVDEAVGVLIEEASPRNLNQLGLHELTVFHLDEAGRFSNGQLSFDAAELGKHVHDVFEDPASVDCASLLPPAPTVEPPPAEGTPDTMVPGVIIGQTVDDDGNPI